MNADELTPVAVASRSFSLHPVLTAELREKYRNLKLNVEGVTLVGDALVEHLAGAERAIIALETVDAALLQKLPGLRVISKFGVGLDNIDMRAMREYGVKLGWTSGVNRRGVAELALMMMISTLRLVQQSRDLVERGEWRQLRGRQLSGKTVGIIGLGHVGRELVGLLEPFGCTILANDIRDVSDFADAHGVELVEKRDLFERSDVITLHVPKDASTLRMIDAAALARMGPASVLINTARGGLVDERALADALIQGRLAGAAMDVFEQEPPAQNALIGLDNFLPTSHIGGSSEEAVLAMGRAAIAGLENARHASSELESFAQ